MKNLVLWMLLMTSDALAGDLHLQKGEKMMVVVEGCKTSEYGVVFGDGRFNHGIEAECLPKYCTYNGMAIGGTRIILQPENRVLAVTHNRRETNTLLEAFVKHEICEKTVSNSKSL